MTIAQIKKQLSITTILNHYNLTPNKNMMLVCPWHADKKPSMKIYTETNTAFCFAGSCDIDSLDVIDFIMKKENSTKKAAIEKAKELCGEVKVVTNLSVSARQKKKAVKTSKLDDVFEKLLMDFKRSRKAKSYLDNRCIYGISTGFKSGGDSWARGCVIFPLRNIENEVVSLYGRSITANNHFYQENRSGLYPKYPTAAISTLVLFESIIDTATLMGVELPLENYELLALYGTNGLTTEHRTAILNLKNLKEIIFALDGDDAGRRATKVHTEVLKKIVPGVRFTTLVLPEDEDVNSIAVAHEKYEAYFNELFNERKEILPKMAVTLKRPVLNTNHPHNLIYKTKLATYYVKGGIRHAPKDFDSLKITLVVANENGLKSRNKLDLYEDKQVEKVCRIAGEKLDLRPDLLELDIQILADELEMYREKIHLEQLKPTTVKQKVPMALKSDCLVLLKTQNLLQVINDLIGKSGIAGEENNRLLLFIIACSFKMPDTLHALIQGSSGSGKTRLMKIIADLMPEEDVKRYTRVTDNSFYNQDEYFFVNKLVCFEDLDGLKEDAQLAVRELQSNEILRTSTSIKDQNGTISGGERVVRGPIASMACTTKGETYEDNISRSFLIAVDESREQTHRIINYQNEISAGLINKKEENKAKVFLQNCIRLLQPYEVINPFANKIKLPEEAHKIRRLNELYQSFVRQITLVNQYQRKTDKQGRLITQKEDLKAACDILFESIVLKVDELDGSLRQFYEKLKEYVKSKGENYAFNRFEIRKITGMSKTQQHRYIAQLIRLEYLNQYGFANRGYTYKIAYWDNMEALRQRIKKALDDQFATI